MKPNELMIGDWVEHASGKYFQVTRNDMRGDGSMHFACGHPHLWEYNNEFSPIPLTEEILERNGFVKMSNCPYAVSYMWSTGGVAEFADVTIGVCQDHADKWRWDCLTLKIHLYKGDIKLNKIRYVHQLQHALRLCGIDKEIEL